MKIPAPIFGFVLAMSAWSAFGQAYFPPTDGWSYTYTGDQASGVPAPGGLALDGKWRNDNGSDEWDGLGLGPNVGLPGGAGSSSGILTIIDAVNTTPPEEPSNRKIYFTHDVSQSGLVTSDFLNTGITLYTRMRLTPSGLEDANGQSVGLPDGYGIFGGGKGNIGIRQAGPTGGSSEGLISFSLVRQIEDLSEFGDTMDFGQPGLTMNRLNGDFTTSAVDSTSSSGTLNLLPLDPTLFHDIWITIRGNGDLEGTHQVDIYLDGEITPTTFQVTAGSGDEGGAFPNYLALGLNNTPTVGAFDVDFLSYKPGVFAPVAVPEPSTLAMLGGGLLALMFWGQSKRKV